ncbi:glycosyl hydrolase family 43 [Saccharopolyspora erythraea NRRL 2338]|nr:glycoside hydrolase family 43 protein [Saccharopolyspora erythraea]PFG98106.1 glycosyl hydrolase family 43 [Saccharopolyspora erythraea NRRL 2338]
MARWRGAVSVVPLLLVATMTTATAETRDPMTTNATYCNDASLPGADPFVLHDRDSGAYFAYSTEGADPGYHFAVYRSPDLATWERLPGGALDAGDGTQWGRDWFWAPEVYHNEDTGKYFLFYSARMRDGVAEHFEYADFEEPSKVGVAVADSPAGPFRNIVDHPIDYFPYDPDYHDVNLIMDHTQKKPPATLEEGMTAPLGTYLPFIDPNVFFDGDRIYLYFSRNAYRNWVWDHDLGKYVEESNIYAVELTADWWHDPAGATMPEIHPSYRDANGSPGDPPLVRKDGFTPVLNYGGDPQPWENAHVNDYAESGGEKKDRRWAEGSTTIKRYTEDGSPVYFMTYSANNYANAYYGVGYAVAEHPLGPWKKSDANPVLEQDEQKSMYSTGHGSVIASPDGSQLYYVHHGRPTTDTGRRLYTERMHLDAGSASLGIEQSTADEPIPAGVAPYSLTSDVGLVDLGPGSARVGWRVATASSAAMGLGNALNRVTATVEPPTAATVEKSENHAVLRPGPGVPEIAALTLHYQRRTAAGSYFGVDNLDGERRTPVAVAVPVTSCTRTLTGAQDSIDVSEGVLCLRDATVSGTVRVRAGAALVALDSTVDGEVDVRGALGVWLSGVEIAGQLRVDGVSGRVRVQDGRVSGPVRLQGNRSASPIVVAGNVFEDSLTCRANSPAPSNEGRPNEVRGAAQGQCARL